MLDHPGNIPEEAVFVSSADSPDNPPVDRIQSLAQALASNYQEIVPRTPGRSKVVSSGGKLQQAYLKRYSDWLAETHTFFLEDSQENLTLSNASEWILDNYYIIRQALQQIKEDLPSGYYNQLPRLASGALKGFPRIYAVSRAVLSYQHLLLDPIDLQAILIQFQDHCSLSMGELWALPIFLRYSLIESLAHILNEAIHPKSPPNIPPPLPTMEWPAGSLPFDTTFAAQNRIGNIILSLRTISEQDWSDFFESVSRPEQTLREQDPSGIYPLMDFKTRDIYRKAIEELSLASGRDENEIFEIAISLSRAGSLEHTDNPVSPAQHVGEYLVGNGRELLEQQIGHHPDARTTFKRWTFAHATSAYLTMVLGMAFLLYIPFIILGLPVFLPLVHLPIHPAPWEVIWFDFQWTAIILITTILAIPALTISTSLVNWLITLLVPPCILPKLDFKDGIPEPFQTLIVIPAMLTSRAEIDSLVQQIELHYLRNPEPGLLFGLLTDFRDADSESMPEDEDLFTYASTSIVALNNKYDCPSPAGETRTTEDNTRLVEPSQQSGHQLFFLLHRKRLWNPSERKWIGWERKRGKLHELNLLLRGADRLTFYPDTISGDWHALQHVHFVITLDTDTILPRGGACRLAGTLAHPANKAVFNPKTGKVTSGYTILQPRMEIHPKSAGHSWFTRIFAGDSGLDLYTLSVSDAFQDLFGEGIFVGKGIYDVDAFEHSVEGRIHENTVLSHDLLEGLMGRAGLVSDITMIEEYPQNYFIQVLRQQRWIRGDWQLLPYLLRANVNGRSFTIIDRWKMFDNLRRALLAPALVLIFILGLLFLPALAGLWTAVLMFSLAIPLLTGLAHSALQVLDGEFPSGSLRPLTWSFLRWLLAEAFLPYETYITVNAVIITLYRVLISHRNLLNWTTAAQTAAGLGSHAGRNAVRQKISLSALFALLLAAGVAALSDVTGHGIGASLLVASPLLLAWILSPFIVWWINRPITSRVKPLTDAQASLLLQVTRRTWGFFERFVGPEDHWLPPDHYQESPVGTIAHHTSPTNIGLLLTSTLAAYDLGYVDQRGLAARLSTTLDSMDQLERYHGHILNWYDTQTLQPLSPRYISTVDSGNLAACLIVTAQACKTMPDELIFRWELWQGYLDTLSNLTETLTGLRKSEYNQQIEDINQLIANLSMEILAVRHQPDLWYPLFLKTSEAFWQDLSKRLIELVMVGRSALDIESLEKLQEVSAQVERLHGAVRHTIMELLPWIPMLANLPHCFLDPRYLEAKTELDRLLPLNLSLSQIADHTRNALPTIASLTLELNEETRLPSQEKTAALEWLDALCKSLAQADANASIQVTRFAQLMERCDRYVNEMDFKFLYHPQRRVFHIGFNLDAGQLDHNYYDLLASEARIASLIAIAKGDVPQSHWMHLGRPVTRVGGDYVLLSWSGTMFEYLMPPLFLRSYPGTLLADSTRGAVSRQIAYGKSKGVPWGISESGFYRFDGNQNYQYRAFGVPGLGFKRGLGDDLVIAPYASLIAVGYDPSAVAHNLAELISRKAIGLYGIYESIDFTSERLLLDQTSVVVEEYMVHHQGMILMAMANFFHENIMVQRMHSDPRIQSVELLLQEQVPHAAPVLDPHSENIKHVKQLTAAPVEIIPWSVPVQTPIPEVHLLSNGEYNVLISNMGGGYSSWRETDLTRWQPDGVMDPWGTWIYLQEVSDDPLHQNKLWSAAHQPVPGNPAEMQVTYFAHMAVFRRAENGVISTLEVTVAPDDPVELRRVHLHNNNEQASHLRLTSYGEVILAPQAADSRHPAFNKLFIETEFFPDLNLQIFKRRPRSNREAPIFLGHMLVVESTQLSYRHEADRSQFIGRGQTLQQPAGLISPGYLTGTSGATLDPIFALGQEIVLEAHQSANLAYLTFAAESREAIMALASRYCNWALVERSFLQSNIAAQTWLGKQEITTTGLQNALQVLSALIYSFKAARAAPDIIASNRLGQPGLWSFGISGDYPILLVEIDDPQQADLIQEVLQIHKYLRSRRFMLDVVLLNQQQTDYGAELNGILYRLVSKVNGEEMLNQRGGIYILNGDHMKPEERILLQTAGRVLLKGGSGSLGDQLPGYSIPVHHLPEFNPTRPVDPAGISIKSSTPHFIEAMDGLQFFNGTGGFTSDGREYVIELPAGKTTPAPWVNVIGYPTFGFMVSEAGSQCTWAINSGENRLSPWSNDPVRDPGGEILYLRDEETGETWTPTPLPRGADQSYRVTHGAGYTIFWNDSHDLRQTLTLFASPEDPVKMIHLKLENTSDQPRRITATQFVEWVLGTTHAANMAFIIPEYDATLECLLATNPYNAEFGSRTAFLIANKAIHGLTADRTEFIGRGGTLNSPTALNRIGLETRITPGEDPCAVLQLHIDLQPGKSEEIYFVLGEGKNREQSLALVKKYHDPAYVGAALQRTHVFWNHLLDTIQIHTPEPAADLILNRWLLYQTLSCRIWGRTGFYQSSGAYGFRDQLQDVLAVLPIDPSIARGQILNAAQHQFEEGDAMHWWHPPSGRGVRTRISDDLLWLAYVTAIYVETTGDISLLQEKTPFLHGALLSSSESEHYAEFPQSDQSFTLIEHCLRAIEKGSTSGAHGLPLIGSGDWNDGLNRVGENGSGESVWLAWFLCDVLKRFAALCEQQGKSETAQRLLARARQYETAVEGSSWDGAWYIRAFYDDGSPLGSSQDTECQIDAIAQSWAVISGAGSTQRSRQAMQSVLDRLVSPQDRLSLLFTPPFDKIDHDPGYVKGYMPGVRENGGQYTHAATWTAWAFAALGNGKVAGDLFGLLNPILRSDTQEKAAAYRVEPYVICADIYSVPPLIGRGGWTWYTGSAAWMYRLGLEAILGFQKIGSTLRIDPVIPPDWDGFDIRYRFCDTPYTVQVKNPDHVEHNVRRVELDGEVIVSMIVPLIDDHLEHHILVLLG